MRDPLAGLDDVPWATLRHAYGPATDTPGLLLRVATHDADDDVWEGLFSSITHQGTVYEASAAAAPFLIALTDVVRSAELVNVLALLESIAAGGADDEATSTRCIDAAAHGFARYVELLTHPEPAVRELAAKLVASFPDRARDARALFEAALDAELDDAVKTVQLDSYDAFVDPEAEGARTRLRTLADDPDGAVAARAAFILVKRAEQTPDRAWLDAIVREAARPVRTTAALDLRDVLRDTPSAYRPALLDAMLRGAPAAADRDRAFSLVEGLLWLAFHARLGGPARPPDPFVFVASLTFPMPSSTGGGAPETMERLPRLLHWRDPDDRPPGVEWTCSPHVHTWDFPRPGYWSVPPYYGPLPGVTIAAPVTAPALSADERRVLALLVRLELFWRTESDLPMVYGLPARRRDLVALVGGGEP